MYVMNEKKDIGNVSFEGVVSVTPEIAKEILEKNPSNRKLNQHRVDSYASDMEQNGWDAFPTGLSITLDKDNNLIDGQHRLNAIIKSGKTMDMFFFRKNVSVEVKNVICDNGMSRSNSFLTGNKANFTAAVSAVIRICSSCRTLPVTPNQISIFLASLTEQESKIIHHIADTNKKGLSSYIKAAFIVYYLYSHYDSTIVIWNNLRDKLMTRESTEYSISSFIDGTPTRVGNMANENIFIGVYSRLKGMKKSTASPEVIFEEIRAVYKSVISRTKKIEETTDEISITEKQPAFALF